jgi:hypothetical protein
MRHPVDFDKDIPSAGKQKEVLFYQTGLKVYGVLPYILHRKLRAEFCSSSDARENNFTLISYQQKSENVQALADWLYKDSGFVWAFCTQKLRAIPDDRLPETYHPSFSFQEAVSQAFGVAVQTPLASDPKPGDVVLGGFGQRPKDDDVVLGIGKPKQGNVDVNPNGGSR